MNNYLILIDSVEGSNNQVVFGKAFGKLMQVHSIIRAKNSTQALQILDSTGMHFGRVEVAKATK